MYNTVLNHFCFIVELTFPMPSYESFILVYYYGKRLGFETVKCIICLSYLICI